MMLLSPCNGSKHTGQLPGPELEVELEWASCELEVVSAGGGVVDTGGGGGTSCMSAVIAAGDGGGTGTGMWAGRSKFMARVDIAYVPCEVAVGGGDGAVTSEEGVDAEED